ncbi:MAG: hypothetical protein ACFB16_06055 [Phormidesmis sp.]
MFSGISISFSGGVSDGVPSGASGGVSGSIPGSLSGGYAVGTFANSSPYLFNLQHVITAMTGVLISPSRGLFFFSPVLLFCLPAIYLFLVLFLVRKTGDDEKLLFALFTSSAILMASYFFYVGWWGGYSYEPRLLTDALPGLVFLLNYFLGAVDNSCAAIRRTWRMQLVLSTFTLATVLSLVVQAAGVYGHQVGADWNVIPLDIDRTPTRIFRLQDNLIQRHLNSLWGRFRIEPMLINNAVYAHNLAGTFSEVSICRKRNIFAASPSWQTRLDIVEVQAPVTNTGRSAWYGYQFALPSGEARVRLKLIDSSGNIAQEDRLYIAGMILPGETVPAKATVSFSVDPGKYRLVLDFVSEGIAEFPPQGRTEQSVLDTELLITEKE